MRDQKKAWASKLELHEHEWYVDIKKRVWVILSFIYKDEKKDMVQLLKMGSRFDVLLKYDDVLAEVEAGNMKILTFE